jgi:hypothetical protein
MRIAEFAIIAALLAAEFALRQLMVDLGIAAKLFAPSGASGLLNMLLAIVYMGLRIGLILGLPVWVVLRWTRRDYSSK